MFLRSVQFREEDIVLLRPADAHTFTEEESWVGLSAILASSIIACGPGTTG